LHLKRDILVSIFAFKFNVYRYGWEADLTDAKLGKDPKVGGLYRLNLFDPERLKAPGFNP
jgi:hypothetical protein